MASKCLFSPVITCEEDYYKASKCLKNNGLILPLVNI